MKLDTQKCVQPASPWYAVLNESNDGYDMYPRKKTMYTFFCDFVAYYVATCTHGYHVWKFLILLINRCRVEVVITNWYQGMLFVKIQDANAGLYWRHFIVFTLPSKDLQRQVVTAWR